MIGLSAALGIYEILDAEPLVGDTADKDTKYLDPNISFNSVVFKYPGSPDTAHRGITFDIAKGARVGVVGPSGSGKSTILKLLLRLYEPESGSIQIGNSDIRDLSFRSLRRQMAIVSQDTYLFHGTVLANIAYGPPYLEAHAC